MLGYIGLKSTNPSAIQGGRRLSLIALLLGSCISTPAYAQSSADKPSADEAAPSSEIVVTAQKRAQSLSEVPISVSVIGGDQIKSNAILSIVDLSTKIPNVNIYEGGQSDIISIRGIGSGPNAGFEQSVATFVDGAYRGRSRSIRSNLFDVERVEVLRGPQSTFFGNNAIAGAFNITTRKANPGEPATGDFAALYEPNHNEYALKGGISFPLGDTLAARVAVDKSGMDGWTKNTVTGHREPQRDDLIGRVSLAWEPSSNWRTDVRIDGGRLRTKGTPFTNELTDCPPPPELGLPAAGACKAYLAAHPSDADTTANYSGGQPETYTRLDYTEAVLQNEATFGDYTFDTVTTFFHHKFDMSLDLIPVDIKSPSGSPSWFEFYSGEKFTQFSQEVRLRSPDDKRVRVTVGAYYLYGKLNNHIYPIVTFLPFGAFLNPALGYNAKSALGAQVLDQRRENLYSVFGLVNVDITKNLRLNVGGRYSISDKTGHRQLNSGIASRYPLSTDGDFSAFVPGNAAQQVAINALLGFQAGDFPNNHRSDKKFMPSVGLELDLAPDIMSYATFARGAKAGGWSIGASANEFDPESVDAYEVGVKGTVFDRKLFFSLAVFRSDYQDLQEAANNALPNGSFVIIVKNAARARAQGVELSLNGRVTPNLTLTFDGSYLDSKYTSFPDAPCNTYQSALKPVGCTQDLSGQGRPLASRWSGSAGADLRIPVGSQYRVRFNPVLAYRSRFNMITTIDPVTWQKGYVTLDAQLAFGKEGAWDLALVGKNLTNTKYATFINTVVSSAGSSATQLGRPRSVALQASLNF